MRVDRSEPENPCHLSEDSACSGVDVEVTEQFNTSLPDIRLAMGGQTPKRMTVPRFPMQCETVMWPKAERSVEIRLAVAMMIDGMRTTKGAV